MSKRIKFTAKVKRGLSILRTLMIDAIDDRKPPMEKMLQDLTAPETSDYNAALAFIEQCEEDLERRHKCVGNRVRVIGGRNANERGVVVRASEGRYVVRADRTGREFEVAPSDTIPADLPPMPAAPEPARCGELVDALA